MGQHLSRVMWVAWISLLAASGTSSAPDRDTVTVMTYNIFHDGEDSRRAVAAWSDRREAVVGTIRSRAPDVVGLQEAEVWQVAWLVDQMPAYAAVARGPYEDPGLVDAETVAILYLRERLELAESGHFWYSESPESPGSYGSSAYGGMSRPRMATWVRLVDRETPGRQGFYVYNTHFIADAQATDPGVARFKSAEMLVRRISDRAHPQAPFLVIGDLNTESEEWPLRYLLGSRCESDDACPTPEPTPEVRMIDSWAWWHPGDTQTGTRCNAATGDDGMRVDYVLVWEPGPEARICDSEDGSCEIPGILSAEIVESGSGCPSDHKPVVAEIELPVPE